MSRTLQFKRYANTVVANTTGSPGELIIDNTNYAITVHDGVVAGGYRIATEVFVTNAVNTIAILANSDLALTQSAYNQANIATNIAQSSYNSANNLGAEIIGLSITTTNAYNQANTAAQVEPQNAQSTTYTLQSSDAGKHIYYTNGSAVNLYIPWTANTTFANGTHIKVISHSTSNVIVTPNSGVSLYFAGNTTPGNHNVTTYGVATLQMVAANTWYIYGLGIN
jgi:hypothetical protein